MRSKIIGFLAFFLLLLLSLNGVCPASAGETLEDGQGARTGSMAGVGIDISS